MKALRVLIWSVDSCGIPPEALPSLAKQAGVPGGWVWNVSQCLNQRRGCLGRLISLALVGAALCAIPSQVFAQPSAPTGLTVDGKTATSVSLSWTAPSNGIVGYSIYRCVQGAGADCTPAWHVWVANSGDAPPAPTSYVDSGLTSGTTYRYQVTANDSNYAESPKSGAVTATTLTPPAAPTGLTVTGSTTSSVSLSWTAPSNDIVGYSIYRCVQGAGADCTPAWHVWVANSGDAPPAPTSYVDSGLTSGTTYRYQVTANGSDYAESPKSGAVMATTLTPPPAPSVLVARAAEEGIRLLWTDSSTDIVGYSVYRCEQSEGGECEPEWRYWVANGASVPPAPKTFLDVDVFAGRTYLYEVTANDVGRLESARSEAATATATAGSAAPPAVPSGLSANAVEEGIALSWAGPAEDIAGYSVYRCAQGEEGDECEPEWRYWVANGADVPPAPTAYLDTEVTAGTTYRYEVTANDTDYFESARSEAATATAMAGSAMPLAAPSGLTASAVEEGIALSWTAPSEDIAGYSVYRCEQGEGDGCDPEWRYWVANEADAPPAPTTYLDTEVTAGATYRYEVAANDADYRESARSEAATVAAGAVVEPPANPAPAFAQGAEIGDLVFTAGVEIEALTLPAAQGGDIDESLNEGELSDYSFDPADLPEGLVFDRFTRELSGTPASVLERTDYTYWVHDDDEDYSPEDADTLALSITVEVFVVPPPAAPRPKGSSVRKALAGFGRTIASDALDLVESRMDRSTHGQSGDHGMTWGGQSNFAGSAAFAQRNGTGQGDPTSAAQGWVTSPESRVQSATGRPVNSMIGLLARTPFEYRLQGGKDTGAESGWRFWARGSVNEFDSDSGGHSPVQGKASSAYLGLDYRFGQDGMLGGAISRSSGTVDYGGGDDSNGELDVSLMTGYQYGAWHPSADTSLWGMFGIGAGDLKLSEWETHLGDADLAFTMGAIGLRRNLATLAEISWAAKADAFLSRLETDNIPDPLADGESPLLSSLVASTWRLRAMMEASRQIWLSEAVLATPSFEFGFLREGGDYEGEYFGEVGAGVSVSHRGLGLEMEAAFSAQASGEDREFDDWRANLTLTIDPGEKGTGLALALSPVWGHSRADETALRRQGGGFQRVLHNHPSRRNTPLFAEERVDLRLSYGIGVNRGKAKLFGQFEGRSAELERYQLGGQVDMDLRGAGILPGILRMEIAYVPGVEQGIHLTFRHRLH